jgi:hypothetical protein
MKAAIWAGVISAPPRGAGALILKEFFGFVSPNRQAGGSFQADRTSSEKSIGIGLFRQRPEKPPAGLRFARAAAIHVLGAGPANAIAMCSVHPAAICPDVYGIARQGRRMSFDEFKRQVDRST